MTKTIAQASKGQRGRAYQSSCLLAAVAEDCSRVRMGARAGAAHLDVLHDRVAGAMVVPLAVVVELVELDPPRALRGVRGGAGDARARLRRARAADMARQVVETNDMPPFAAQGHTLL